MSATASTMQITVPDIGDFGEVPIIEILVAAGDTVAAEDPLITLESDKATMDVPSPSAGTVSELQVKVGDMVSQGTVILTLQPGSESPTQSPPAKADEAPAPTSEPAPRQESKPPAARADVAASQPSEAPPELRSADRVNGDSNGNGASAVYASPSVRRIARELGVDLHGVSGSGRKGRLTVDDVRSANAGGQRTTGGVPTNGSGLDLAPWPVVDFEKFGPVERIERSRIQKISAPNLARNWMMIPHVTHNDEADITELEAWRRQLNSEQGKDGVKFTMVSFLIAASVATLKEFPTFNSSLDGDQLVLRRYFNIGFAADTPGGLVVPVIKNADGKGLVEVARELTELSGKAREGKLGPADMAGGTFTISSLGGIGGTSFTPIINAPEVAILGVTQGSRSSPSGTRPRTNSKPRLMVPLSLSYDHRVIDGASAARFVAHLVEVLSDLRRALL